ncbi:DMT family transporter [Pantoea sp. 1.19]|uniref:DMT family transporter n=1 Tax=Pantoea sp. 1.19 TaxID=1925589 RepID=UPI0009490396|nr:DMT family transporter [Pantoea sp. 1.19]
MLRSSQALTLLLFVIVALTWGTTWMAMKIAVETVPPIFATGLRFLCAAPLLLLLARWRRAPLLFPRGQRGFQLAVTLAYFAVPFTLMIYGERYTAASLAAIIFATMPVAVLGASMLFLRERTSRQQLLGLAIALLALGGILWHETRGGMSSTIGIMALTAAVLMHAVMYVLCKKRGAAIPVLSWNALPCLGAGVLLTLTGWLTEAPHVAQFTPAAIGAIVWLGALAGVGGILCYFALQQRARPFQASLVFLVFPVIAIALDNLLRGSSISEGSLWLMLPLLTGILLTLAGQPAARAAKVAATADARLPESR